MCDVFEIISAARQLEEKKKGKKNVPHEFPLQTQIFMQTYHTQLWFTH